MNNKWKRFLTNAFKAAGYMFCLKGLKIFKSDPDNIKNISLFTFTKISYLGSFKNCTIYNIENSLGSKKSKFWHDLNYLHSTLYSQ